MRTIATAPVFGRSMRIASVQEYFSIPETIDGESQPERRYAVVTVYGHNGGLLPGVITPLDSVFIDAEEFTGESLRESYAKSQEPHYLTDAEWQARSNFQPRCVICREMQPLRCDKHSDY